jgi:hypothetical protein
MTEPAELAVGRRDRLGDTYRNENGVTIDQLIESLQQERDRLGGDKLVMASQEDGETHMRKVVGIDGQNVNVACIFFSVL